MQVRRLLLSGQIDHKTASLTLYALQIASSNLARTSFEASRPTKVVVDREKVAEMPLGATPWPAKGEGHEPEDDVEAAEEESGSDGRSFLERLGLCDALEDEEEGEDDGLPPGTIQACRGEVGGWCEEDPQGLEPPLKIVALTAAKALRHPKPLGSLEAVKRCFNRNSGRNRYVV